MKVSWFSSAICEFSQWVKDAPTVWAFPTILFVHTFGMAIVAGGSAMLSLIVLGFWPAGPIKPFARAFRWLWLAFGINAVSGTMMLVADATTKLTTVDFCPQDGVCLCGIIPFLYFSKCANKYSRIRNSTGSPAVGQREKMLALLRWLAGLAPLSPAVCWPTSSSPASPGYSGITLAPSACSALR